MASGSTQAFKINKSNKYLFYLLAAVIYFVLALARFGNITTHIATIIPGHDGDTFQNIWSIWWVNYALFHLHQGIFYTKLLYWPIGSNLVFETMSPIGSLLSYPFQAVSIPFAYNMLFFLSFPLSGIGMLILADYLVKNRYAAFFAGLIFSFSAFHIAEAYAHLDWMFIGWVPLAIYFFLRILDEDKMQIWPSVGLGITFVFTVFMGDVEQGIILSMALFAILLFYLIYKAGRDDLDLKKVSNTIKKIAIAIVIALILGSWGFIPLVSAALKPGNTITINQFNTVSTEEAQDYAVASFFLPNFYNGLLTSSVLNSPSYPLFSSIERTGYITYTVLALCIFGIYKERKRTRLWIALAILFGWLALGPYIQFYGTASPIPGLFLLAHALPLINVIQEPGRMGIIFLVATSVLASIGVVELIKFLDKFDKKKYFTIAAIALLLLIFLIETSGSPVTYGQKLIPTTTNVTIPKFYYAVGNRTGNFSILQLPALPGAVSEGVPQFYTGQATYYTVASHKDLVGGYITRDNYTEYYYLYDIPLAVQTDYPDFFNSSAYLSPINENYTNQTLLTLYNFNTALIAIDKQAYTSAALYSIEDYMVNTFGDPIYNDNSTMVFPASNAISNAVFKSYVTYYTFKDWIPVEINYYGKNITVWPPTNGGIISIYAPSNKTRTYANATLTFYASSDSGGYAQLYISYQSGLGRIEPLVAINVTPNFNKYQVRLSDLTRGDLGNSVFFVASNQSEWAKINNSSDVAITNITVSNN